MDRRHMHWCIQCQAHSPHLVRGGNKAPLHSMSPKLQIKRYPKEFSAKLLVFRHGYLINNFKINFYFSFKFDS